MTDHRPTTSHEVLSWCRQGDVKAVDLRFTDFLGQQQHFTIPVDKLTVDVFEDGLGFDGSSIRGWQSIHESDMIAVPQPKTAFIDPFCSASTAVLLCNVQDPVSREDYSRDPRNVARKALDYLQSSGVADTCYVGPECEFFLFDSARFDQNEHEGYYHLDSREGQWNRGRATPTNLSYQPRTKEAYFPTPPSDHFHEIRTEMMLEMIRCGLDVECHHHEVASGGQCEIDLKYSSLLEMADAVMIYKYVVKNVARRNQMTATFMPKPLFGDNGSGMHTHVSLWKQGKPLFAGNGYAGLSDVGLWAIGGILRHAPALAAFCCPTTNSYKRLVPGFEAPVYLSYSGRNRSAACRIPMLSQNPAAKRVEFRSPDPSCNPYLAFSAILMAMLDGVQNKFSPGDPLDKDIYHLADAERDKLKQMPSSLDAALAALAQDHEFLMRGEVFTEDVIQTWLNYKRTNDVAALRSRPHPYEFCMYFDA